MKTPQRYWSALGIMALLDAALFLWTLLDRSCSGGAFLCLPLSALALIAALVLTPVILAAVFAASVRSDVSRPGASDDEKRVLRRARTVFLWSFAAILAACALWYYNYHERTDWLEFLLLRGSGVLLASTVIAVLYLHSARRQR